MQQQWVGNSMVLKQIMAQSTHLLVNQEIKEEKAEVPKTVPGGRGGCPAIHPLEEACS